MLIIGGSSHPKLVERVCLYLNDNGYPQLKQCNVDLSRFPDGQQSIQIKDNIRGKDVVIIQTSVNNGGEESQDYHIIQTLLLISVCKMADARNITVVFPFFPYARADKKDEIGIPIGSSLMSNLLIFTGADRLVAFDLHSGQIQGNIQKPFDNLYAAKILIEYLGLNNLSEDECDKYCIVSPDAGGAKRADGWAKTIGCLSTHMAKTRKGGKVVKVSLAADVDGLNCIIVDDMIDTAGTMIEAVNILAEKNAASIIIAVTHGVLSGSAIDRINSCDKISRVIVTDTLPQNKYCKKLEVVSIGSLLGEAIKRIHTRDNSISDLF